MHTLSRPGFRPPSQRKIYKKDLLHYSQALDRDAKQFQLAVASETFLQLLARTLRNQYYAIRQSFQKKEQA